MNLFSQMNAKFKCEQCEMRVNRRIATNVNASIQRHTILFTIAPVKRNCKLIKIVYVLAHTIERLLKRIAVYVCVSVCVWLDLAEHIISLESRTSVLAVVVAHLREFTMYSSKP